MPVLGRQLDVGALRLECGCSEIVPCVCLDLEEPRVGNILAEHQASRASGTLDFMILSML